MAPYQWVQLLSYKTLEKEQIEPKVTRRKYIMEIRFKAMKQEEKNIEEIQWNQILFFWGQ